MTDGVLTVLRKCTGLKRLEVNGYFMQNINDRYNNKNTKDVMVAMLQLNL
jgi:hypothetical protein